MEVFRFQTREKSTYFLYNETEALGGRCEADMRSFVLYNMRRKYFQKKIQISC